MLPPSWDNFFSWFHPRLIGQSILIVFVLPHLLTFKFEGVFFFFFLTNRCSIHTDLHVFLEHPNMSLFQGFSNSSLLCLECSSCRNPQCLFFLSFSSLLPYHFITFFFQKGHWPLSKVPSPFSYQSSLYLSPLHYFTSPQTLITI